MDLVDIVPFNTYLHLIEDVYDTMRKKGKEEGC